MTIGRWINLINYALFSLVRSTNNNNNKITTLLSLLWSLLLLLLCTRHLYLCDDKDTLESAWHGIYKITKLQTKFLCIIKCVFKLWLSPSQLGDRHPSELQGTCGTPQFGQRHNWSIYANATTPLCTGHFPLPHSVRILSAKKWATGSVLEGGILHISSTHYVQVYELIEWSWPKLVPIVNVWSHQWPVSIWTSSELLRSKILPFVT